MSPSSRRHNCNALREISIGQYEVGRFLHSASRMRRVFRPLPLPSSATVTSCGKCATISAACSVSSRSSARVTPYSGSTVITSKSADPTSSYRYFDGNSFCGECVRPARTSAAKVERNTSGEASCDRAGWVMLAPVVTFVERFVFRVGPDLAWVRIDGGMRDEARSCRRKERGESVRAMWLLARFTDIANDAALDTRKRCMRTALQS